MKQHPLIEYERRMAYGQAKHKQLEANHKSKSESFVYTRYKRLLRYKREVMARKRLADRKIPFNFTEQQYREWLIGHDLYMYIRLYIENGQEDWEKDRIVRMCVETFNYRMSEELDWFSEDVTPTYPVTPFAGVAKIDERK